MLSLSILAAMRAIGHGDRRAHGHGFAINDGNAFDGSELKLTWQATIRG